MDVRRRANGPLDTTIMPRDATAALLLSRIGKRFGGLVALDDVSITVRPGTVHAVLGENGAGKSTLMHIAYGLLAADGGTVSVGGAPLAMRSPLDAIRAGIGMVHQHFTLVPAMTVSENIALGGRGRLREADSSRRVLELAERTGFVLDAAARVESLAVGAQQRVEIAKALAHDATLLILDEPTAVLAPAEIDDLLRWLRAFVDRGNAAVLVTHKLHEAFAVADDITVLRKGRVVHTGPARELTPEQLTVAMIGTVDMTNERPIESSRPAGVPPVFAARDVSVSDDTGRVRVRNASFEIYPGEIVGIAAIEGAGQRELLRALAGRCAVSAGTLALPRDVGFVPEDRHRDAVLLERSLSENIALRGAGVRRGLVNWNSVGARARELMEAFDVRASGPEAPMHTLSGGNQQKLVLARELSPDRMVSGPTALVVENPTRGLDVRATVDVHRRLRDAATVGTAVVVYSSDLDEVLALASRVFVIFGGILRELPPDRERVGRAMLGTS